MTTPTYLFDQIAAEAADRLRDEEGAHFHRDVGISIIKSAIEKAREAELLKIREATFVEGDAQTVRGAVRKIVDPKCPIHDGADFHGDCVGCSPNIAHASEQDERNQEIINGPIWTAMKRDEEKPAHASEQAETAEQAYSRLTGQPYSGSNQQREWVRGYEAAISHERRKAERIAVGIAKEVLHKTSATYPEGKIIEAIVTKYLSATADGADTKRLDWLERHSQWHDPHRRMKVIFPVETVTFTTLRAAIDAAMSQRPKLKEITIEDATFGDLEA